LKELRDKIEPTYLPYLPDVKDSLALKEGSVIRRATVLGNLEGFYTMADIKKAYPSGISGQDGAWMWRRVLTALGAIHRAGFVHGAILPQHMMILGEQRGLVIVGWTAAQKDGAPIEMISIPDRDAYPPDLLAKKPSSTDMDIFMAARIVRDLIGPRLHRQMARHFKAAMLPRPGMRPDDAWALKDAFDELNERLYGERKFRPFKLTEGDGYGWR
jgi:hypothetical protein